MTIQPGTFRDAADFDLSKEDFEIGKCHDERANWHLTAEPDYFKGLINQYEFFRKNIFNPKRVFYPSSSVDASPVKGFPDSEVVLMDRDEQVSYVMKKYNIKEFIQGDVLAYTPEKPFDLVIMLNPCLKSSDLTRHLVLGGYAMANNWNNNASQLLKNKDFEGVGTILRDKKGPFLAKKDFSRLEPHQFATLFYVFKKLQETK